jgi:hypothetical protein
MEDGAFIDYDALVSETTDGINELTFTSAYEFASSSRI